MSTLEPPSDEPRRGLSKLRRSKKDSDKTSSTSSLTPPQDEGSGSSGGLRASIDGAIEKLKDRRRRSTDERRSSIDSTSNKRLSKLPLQLSKKSRRKRFSNDDDVETNDNDDDNNHDDRRLSPSPSELSMGLQGSGHSSLMTEDSDYDE